MISIDKATVKISEQTIRELVRAIDEVKNSGIEFTDAPMPDGDMSLDTARKLKKERGIILVSSQFAPLDFEVRMETRPHSQESCGYKVVE